DIKKNRKGGRLPEQGGVREDGPQVTSVDKLVRNKELLIDGPVFEKACDVRMLKPRGDLGLVFEHLDELFILRDRRKDSLEGDKAPLLNVPRAKHLRHAAGAQAPKQLVWTKCPVVYTRPGHRPLWAMQGAFCRRRKKNAATSAAIPAN